MTVKTHLFVIASVIDLKARSMRDNLVFTGIQEDDREDTEEFLQAFLHRKFKLGNDIQYERVHRVGKYNEFSEHSRNIVAKFISKTVNLFAPTPQKIYAKHASMLTNNFHPKSNKKERHCTLLWDRRRKKTNGQSLWGIFFTSMERCTPQPKSPPQNCAEFRDRIQPEPPP